MDEEVAVKSQNTESDKADHESKESTSLPTKKKEIEQIAAEIEEESDAESSSEELDRDEEMELASLMLAMKEMEKLKEDIEKANKKLDAMMGAAKVREDEDCAE
ncbi:unnamed protein product [Orchesella dallaii]|uniref:Uncharacterized protein n=1 Tax=Orchesella dallaii TaxID=48710 RepID=A0ABP1PSS7_9HEXA